jgi:hypothetical protein
MAEKKMTKATAMTLGAEALAAVNPEAAEILAKEAARLSAPRKATGKVSKEQAANMASADALLVAMEPEVKYTATEAGKLVGIETSQKATAVLKLLVEAGAVVKEAGRKTLYSRVA